VFSTVVVASDGSESADQALRAAGSLVHSGGRLVIVHVVEMVGGKGGMVPITADEEEIRRKLVRQASELRADDLMVEVAVHTTRLGGPAAVIAAEAELVGADLIVTGSRGQSPLTQFVVGSVPVRLLHLASCPVLVVPATSGGG
jgi:nucleotide-binding universal stress UspA family protein